MALRTRREEYHCPFLDKACLESHCRVWDAGNKKCSLKSLMHSGHSIIDVKTLDTKLTTTSQTYTEIASLQTTFNLGTISDILIFLNMAIGAYIPYRPDAANIHVKLELDDGLVGNAVDIEFAFSSYTGKEKLFSIIRGIEDVAVGDHTLKVYWKKVGGYAVYSATQDQTIIAV